MSGITLQPETPAAEKRKIARDFQLKPTRALRRILQLKSRIWGIQGGQGAGKTFSILWLICDYAYKNPNKQIYVASKELTKMRITVIKDFKTIMRELGYYEKTRFPGETLYIFPNGTTIKFLGLDSDDIGKGLRSDLVFVNEANKINFETYRELTSRARRIIIDFNPNEKFWYHREVMTRSDCQHLKLTFLDNECLSREERAEILGYLQKGYDKNLYDVNNLSQGIVNEYWANKWKIYGLGIIGGVEGRIYYWNPCSYVDYLKINKRTIFYSDWGKSDPWAIGEVKYDDMRLYVHERNYTSENDFRATLNKSELQNIIGRNPDGTENEGLVSWRFQNLQIPKDALILCDNNRPEKVKALRRAGWEYALAVPANNKAISGGVDILQNLEIFYTETSTNIEFEQEVYKWAVDRHGDPIDGVPEDLNNHHMDGIRYVAAYLASEGVIRAA